MRSSVTKKSKWFLCKERSIPTPYFPYLAVNVVLSNFTQILVCLKSQTFLEKKILAFSQAINTTQCGRIRTEKSWPYFASSPSTFDLGFAKSMACGKFIQYQSFGGECVPNTIHSTYIESKPYMNDTASIERSTRAKDNTFSQYNRSAWFLWIDVYWIKGK